MKCEWKKWDKNSSAPDDGDQLKLHLVLCCAAAAYRRPTDCIFTAALTAVAFHGGDRWRAFSLMTQRTSNPLAWWTYSCKASALSVCSRGEGREEWRQCLCVCFVSLCEVNHGDNRKKKKKEDAWLLPAFLQISSGRYPEGGLCKKSRWISETHTQAHTQCRLHAHGDKLLICSNTHPSMTALQFPVLFLESIKRYKKVKCVYIYMWQHQYSKQAAIGFLQLFVGRKWNMGARREYKS